jgi:hypothetical protein
MTQIAVVHIRIAMPMLLEPASPFFYDFDLGIARGHPIAVAGQQILQQTASPAVPDLLPA